MSLTCLLFGHGPWADVLVRELWGCVPVLQCTRCGHTPAKPFGATPCPTPSSTIPSSPDSQEASR